MDDDFGVAITPQAPKGTQIQSASRAVQVLLTVADATDGRTAKEIAQRLDVPVSTAYHLLNTLVAEGFLVKESSRRFFLGPEIGTLSDAFLRQTSPPEYLRHAVVQLAEITEETAYVSTWRNGDSVVLACVEGSHAVRVSGLHSGSRGNAHARASGKVLLAYARSEILERFLLTNPLRALTENTIVSEVALRAELEMTRQRGYALDDEEFTLGVACVAAPAMAGETIVAALALSAPAERFRRRKRDLIDAVLKVSQGESFSASRLRAR